jgi:hypothetical protein
MPIDLKNSDDLVFSGRRQPAITALAEISGFLVHQKTISQCGGLPGPFSTAEASLIFGYGNLTDSIKRFPDKSGLLSLLKLVAIVLSLISSSPNPNHKLAFSAFLAHSRIMVECAVTLWILKH